MKKLFICFLLTIAFGFTMSAQDKSVPLSIKNFELYSILKKGNTFKDFPSLPETVTEHYVGGELQYTTAETDKFTLKIMADGEFRFKIKKPATTFADQTYFIRFPNNTVFGYALQTRKDGVVQATVYQGEKFVYTGEIKK
ncbi:hypothetical protein R1T16_01430 [Flavobacterium sp. DG1-102-2]|uniref:hypothetical protein n=1 Tax=Flavobacterium sp. DG1-102-2 TaxID=3081663 RepID=UPI0029492027|nr:hypothetical protein [Flavobacterium sp. DG1-102-2]MDV6167066.1 hypothetical protein [Flavobacterium sp. DG1-102-2]